MWPNLLDMSKLECKKALRTLELEAYAMIVSAFRAQGDLNPKKIDILKELQIMFKISIDRHKAELRRATNDDKLYTIAKLMSHGDCVSAEWIKHSKRLIPLLPSLHNSNYRILADQVLAKAEPVLNLYPEQNQIKENKQSSKSMKNKKIRNKDESFELTDLNEDDELNSGILCLKNGYAVDSKSVSVENTQPSEYIKRFESINETEKSNSKSFLTFLIQKYKQQKHEDTRSQNEGANSKPELKLNELDHTLQNPQIEQTQVEVEHFPKIADTSIKLECQAPHSSHQIASSNMKPPTSSLILTTTSQMIKLKTSPHFPTITTLTNSSQTSSALIKLNNPKFTFPKPSQKLIILPTATGSQLSSQSSHGTQNLKILTVQPTSLNHQKILFNVPNFKPGLNLSDNFALKRKLSDLGKELNLNGNLSKKINSNLVCLKLDKFDKVEDESSKNGYHSQNGSDVDESCRSSQFNSKRIKLNDFSFNLNLANDSLNANTNSNSPKTSGSSANESLS